MTSGFTAATQHHWDELGSSLKVEGVRVLFIDTLSELAGSDATTRQVQDVFGMLSNWRRKYDITVVMIGHSSSHKDSFGKKKTELLGVTAWVAKARHTVLVSSNTTGTFANVQKSNRGPVGFNVTFNKVDGGPVTVLSTNTHDEYVEERKQSTQKRDWEKKRSQAVRARAAGSAHWGSLEALGTAAGGSKTIGRNLVHAGFFRERAGGGYEPVVAVIGVPDNEHGEEIKACVVKVADNATTEQELINYCKEHLAAYKYPRVVQFMDALPMTSTGKILKRELS